jgi:uncharacterized protein (TIGR00725 family)
LEAAFPHIETMSSASARRPIIGVMGAGDPSPAALEIARRFGRLAEQGWILLTGGRPDGVMEAASAGAREIAGSLTLGILPSNPDGPVGRHIDIAVFTGMGDARNMINVLTSDVVVACGVEGPGTASEVALALKAGRPTVLLAASAEAVAFFHSIAAGRALHIVATPDDAIRLIHHQLGVAPWRV